jgi:hypothetical protein
MSSSSPDGIDASHHILELLRFSEESDVVTMLSKLSSTGNYAIDAKEVLIAAGFIDCLGDGNCWVDPDCGFRNL